MLVLLWPRQVLARRVVRETRDLPLDEALAKAVESWMTLVGSEERVEGHRAFVEKRPPSWVVEGSAV